MDTSSVLLMPADEKSGRRGRLQYASRVTALVLFVKTRLGTALLIGLEKCQWRRKGFGAHR